MKKLRILYYLLFIFLFFELIYCDNEETTPPPFIKFTEKYKRINESEVNITENNNSCIEEIFYLNNNIYEDIYLGNIKILETKNKEYIFRNFRRKNTNISATFTLYNEIEKCFESWPKKENKSTNENTSYSDEFISVVNFEFDHEDNIYILDEGNEEFIKIYKYNIMGDQLANFTISKKNNIEMRNLVLSDFVIDPMNNYFYIASSYYDASNDLKHGVIKNNMSNDMVNFLSNSEKINYDEEYKIKNEFINNYFNNDIKKYINIALSCDGQALFLSPLSSKMIFSIPTENTQDVENNTINEAYKNDLSFSIQSGNLGNLYLAGIEKNKIYIAGQIDNDLSIFNYRGLDSIDNYGKCSFSKISINNGVLYIICKTLKKENNDNDNFTLVTTIYNYSIEKEKSYVYKCAGLNYKWDLKSYIIWGIFSLILCFVLVFVFIENKQDKDINKKNN